MACYSLPFGEGSNRQNGFAWPGLNFVDPFAEFACATLRRCGTSGDNAVGEDLMRIDGIETITGVKAFACDVGANDFGNSLREAKDGNSIGSRGAFECLQLGCLRNMKLYQDCSAGVRVGVTDIDHAYTKLRNGRS
jgi:hypothetical protein